MRRTSATALAGAVAAWAGLVWAGNSGPPTGAIEGLSSSAGAVARARAGGEAGSASGGSASEDSAPAAPTASSVDATEQTARPSPAVASKTRSSPAASEARTPEPSQRGPASATADESGGGSDDTPHAGRQAAAPHGADEQPAQPEAAVAGMPAAVPVSALVPAKQLFGSVNSAASLEARAIGKYSRGCLAGAVALPVDGPQWQAMRLSRNRNWGHPVLIRTIERLADEAWRYDGWNGLLVGDISQPRGGPMLTGHASHQIGLDADVWLTPMPDRRLSVKEREELAATSMLASDEVTINRTVFTPAHYKILKRAASYNRVERVLVHPGIKKALCEDATAANDDKSWLHKVRPYWGHYYHFHVRIGCPEGSANCTRQDATPNDDGCGKELSDWIRRVTPAPPAPEPKEPKPPVVAVPKKPPPPPVTLADLPQECRVVLSTGKPGIPKPLLEKQARADRLLAEHAKAMAAARAAHARAAHAKAEHAKAEQAKAQDGKAQDAKPKQAKDGKDEKAAKDAKDPKAPADDAGKKSSALPTASSAAKTADSAH